MVCCVVYQQPCSFSSLLVCLCVTGLLVGPAMSLRISILQQRAATNPTLALSKWIIVYSKLFPPHLSGVGGTRQPRGCLADPVDGTSCDVGQKSVPLMSNVLLDGKKTGCFKGFTYGWVHPSAIAAVSAPSGKPAGHLVVKALEAKQHGLGPHPRLRSAQQHRLHHCFVKI